MTRTIIALTLSLLLTSASAGQTTRPTTTRSSAIRVACCGDSITRRPVGAAYSDHLAKMLGDGWDVRNFGHDGVTAQKDSGRPYWKMPELEAANGFQPNVVILMLGTNDAASVDEQRKNFARDFRALVHHFKALPSKPQVIVMTPPPLMPGREDSRMNNLKNDLSPHVRRIAKEEGLVLVELQELPRLADPSLYPDKVHPNSDGTRIIAECVRDAMRERQFRPATSN
jgi:lysophospholipase L1-like esterase